MWDSWGTLVPVNSPSNSQTSTSPRKIGTKSEWVEKKLSSITYPSSKTLNASPLQTARSLVGTVSSMSRTECALLQIFSSENSTGMEGRSS